MTAVRRAWWCPGAACGAGDEYEQEGRRETSGGGAWARDPRWGCACRPSRAAILQEGGSAAGVGGVAAGSEVAGSLGQWGLCARAGDNGNSAWCVSCLCQCMHACIGRPCVRQVPDRRQASCRARVGQMHIACSLPLAAGTISYTPASSYHPIPRSCTPQRRSTRLAQPLLLDCSRPRSRSPSAVTNCCRLKGRAWIGQLQIGQPSQRSRALVRGTSGADLLRLLTPRRGLRTGRPGTQRPAHPVAHSAGPGRDVQAEGERTGPC